MKNKKKDKKKRQEENELRFFSIPEDKILESMENDVHFKKYLTNMCIDNSLRYDDVKRCLGGLYDVASKRVHGRSIKMEIYEREWEPTDAAVLATLFRFYKIPYDYYDTNGDLKVPYKFPDT